MDAIALLVIKFLLYCTVLACAVRLLQVPVADARPFVLKWSALRLGMGLVFGLLIMWLYSLSNAAGHQQVLSYALSFGVVRVVEWSLVLVLLVRGYKVKSIVRGAAFILLGVAANVTFDVLAHLAGVEDHLKFVC